MDRKRRTKLLVSLLFGILALHGSMGAAVAAEPVIADYTAYPLFMANEIAPNIMVILDNSGSMNYPAYGTLANYYAYLGRYYHPVLSDDYRCRNVAFSILQSQDDAEEQTSNYTTYYNDSDLDLGSFNAYDSDGDGVYESSNNAVSGLRFNSVSIPQGRTILKAYIEFVAIENSQTLPSETNFVIVGEAADAAAVFNTTLNNIKSRTATSASVNWNNVGPWTKDDTYRSPDISAIVQEIVDRGGWSQGSALSLKITGTGKRNAYTYDNTPTKAAKLYVEYSGCQEFYGYFDPTSNYTYSSSQFVRDPAGAWNGNFLNWLTMRRIDVARKVFMGGKATPR